MSSEPTMMEAALSVEIGARLVRGCSAGGTGASCMDECPDAAERLFT